MGDNLSYFSHHVKHFSSSNQLRFAIEKIQAAKQEAKQEGRQEGRQQGELDLLRVLLKEIVGNVPPELDNRITLLSLKKLPELAKALLRFGSILFQRRYANDDLALWLTNNQ